MNSGNNFTHEVCKRKNYNYGVAVIILFYIEAVYRYFESRRRQINDSKPERRHVVEAQKKSSKQRVLKKQVSTIMSKDSLFIFTTT